MSLLKSRPNGLKINRFFEINISIYLDRHYLSFSPSVIVLRLAHVPINTDLWY